MTECSGQIHHSWIFLENNDQITVPTMASSLSNHQYFHLRTRLMAASTWFESVFPCIPTVASWLNNIKAKKMMRDKVRGKVWTACGSKNDQRTDLRYEHVRNPGRVPSEISVYGTATFHDTEGFQNPNMQPKHERMKDIDAYLHPGRLTKQ